MAGERAAHPGCKDDGCHGNIYDATSERDRRQFALVVEGICPTCELLSERTDDGFTRCPCCLIEWQLQGRRLLAGFDMSAFLTPEIEGGGPHENDLSATALPADATPTSRPRVGPEGA